MSSKYDYGSIVGFEWDERKSELNRTKHGIDFEDAIEVFYGSIVLRRSDRNNEERWIAIGSSENKFITVVFTRRVNVIRIISARRARKNEEREYRNAKVGRAPEGQDWLGARRRTDGRGHRQDGR